MKLQDKAVELAKATLWGDDSIPWSGESRAEVLYQRPARGDFGEHTLAGQCLGALHTAANLKRLRLHGLLGGLL